MAPNYKENYVNGVVICHGKSEWLMAKHISSNLHLRVKLYAKDKGKYSIQITALKKLLTSKPFNKQSAFVAEYPVEEVGKGKNKRLENFKLFIIMDTDDCTEQQKKDYLSRKMFEGHWLHDYIVPIVNTPNLEEVLTEVGMMPKKIRDDEKGEYYAKVFPVNDKPLSDDTLKEVLTLRDFVNKSRSTNLPEYIDYCLSLLPDTKDQAKQT